MKHHGTDFGVDIFRLWECAAIDLPPFAARGVDAANLVVQLDSMAVGGGPGTRQIMAAWTGFGAEVRGAIADSTDHVYQACDALMRIADGYAAADTAARAEFQRRRRDEISKHAADGTLADTPASRPRIGRLAADQF